MPKTREQFEKIRKERMASILRCAADLFATKGYLAVTADDITNAASCSHGLLYHYYRSKEEIYKATIEQIALPTIREIFSHIDFKQKAIVVLRQITDALFTVLKSPDDTKAKDIYLLMNLYLQKNLAVVKKNEEGHTFVFSNTKEIIERGQKEGNIIDYNSVELTISFLSILKGISFNRINIGYPKFICPHSEIVINMLLKKEER